MIQRAHVIDDFCGVVKPLSFRRFLPFFKSNDLIECGIDSFDSGAEQRFLAHIHPNEEIRVWRSVAMPSSFPKA